jgi:hypothetical protein
MSSAEIPCGGTDVPYSTEEMEDRAEITAAARVLIRKLWMEMVELRKQKRWADVRGLCRGRRHPEEGDARECRAGS